MQQLNGSNSKNDIIVGTTIELFWPPNGKWQTGTITKDWGNGECSINFPDDPWDCPISYRLSSYDYRIICQPKDIQSVKNDENDKSEIEAIIDYVKIVNSDPLLSAYEMYRVKWYNLSMSKCTWEEKSSLVENANKMIVNYEKQLQSQSHANKILNIKDKELLYDLLHFLNDISNENNSASIASWKSNGLCFQIIDVSLFEDVFLRQKWYKIMNRKQESNDKAIFNRFVARLIEFGFEISASMNDTRNLYFHPLFNQQSIVNDNIKKIACNAIALPNAKQKYKTFQMKASEEHRRFLQKKNAQMMISGNSVRSNRSMKTSPNSYLNTSIDMDITTDIISDINALQMNVNEKPKYVPNAGKNVSAVSAMYVPSSIGIDLNQCHLWTEYDVAEWIRHLDTTSTWGEFYASKFVENGIDGRILLESDIEMLIQQCQMHAHHSTPFIFAVNQLRNVRNCVLH